MFLGLFIDYLENYGPPDSMSQCIDLNNYATIYLTQTAWRLMFEYQRSVAFHFPFNMTGPSNILVVRLADFNFGSVPCTTEHLTVTFSSISEFDYILSVLFDLKSEILSSYSSI